MKILTVVILAVAIYVMNDLFRFQLSSQHALCDNPVLMPSIFLNVRMLLASSSFALNDDCSSEMRRIHLSAIS